VRSIAAATSLSRNSCRGFPLAGLASARFGAAATNAKSSASQPRMEGDFFTPFILSAAAPIALSARAGVWEVLRPGLWQRFEQRRNCGIVAKRLADVREPIHVTRSEHEASA
jgi:hypothetical protein